MYFGLTRMCRCRVTMTVTADGSGGVAGQGGVVLSLGEPRVYFGLSSDVPVPADYDGDGSAEVSVFRPEFGGWYVAGSRPPCSTGWATDIPLSLPAAVYTTYY